MLTAILGAIPLPLLVGWLVVINVATAAAYAYDKLAARAVAGGSASGRSCS